MAYQVITSSACYLMHKHHYTCGTMVQIVPISLSNWRSIRSLFNLRTYYSLSSGYTIVRNSTFHFYNNDESGIAAQKYGVHT